MIINYFMWFILIWCANFFLFVYCFLNQVLYLIIYNRFIKRSHQNLFLTPLTNTLYANILNDLLNNSLKHLILCPGNLLLHTCMYIYLIDSHHCFVLNHFINEVLEHLSFLCFHSTLVLVYSSRGSSSGGWVWG